MPRLNTAALASTLKSKHSKSLRKPLSKLSVPTTDVNNKRHSKTSYDIHHDDGVMSDFWDNTSDKVRAFS